MPATSTDPEATQSADTQAGEPGGELMLDLFGEAAEPHDEPEADGAVRTQAVEPAEDAASVGGEPHVEETAHKRDEALESLAAAGSERVEPEWPKDEAAGTRAAAMTAPTPEAPERRDVLDAVDQRDDRDLAQQEQLAATAATTATAPSQAEATIQESPEPSPGSVPGLLDAVKEPEAAPLSASGYASYAPTSATGDAARVVSAVHLADTDPALHAPLPGHAASFGAGRAEAVLPPETVAAMALQARRTKWMLTAAVAALVVTAGVAIAQTLVLANLSADTAAQRQRFDVLMQNQQAALDSVTARLAEQAAVPVAAMAMAPAAAATGAAREPESATPSRRAARAARTAKSAQKSASHATGSKSSKARSTHSTRQASAKS